MILGLCAVVIGILSGLLVVMAWIAALGIMVVAPAWEGCVRLLTRVRVPKERV